MYLDQPPCVSDHSRDPSHSGTCKSRVFVHSLVTRHSIEDSVLLNLASQEKMLCLRENDLGPTDDLIVVHKIALSLAN